MSLNDTVRAADAIVTGTVISHQSRWGDLSRRWMQTDYTLAVEDVVYPSEQGAPVGKTIVLTYWGGTIDGVTQQVPDIRLPVDGERLVVLLQPLWVKGGAVAPTVGFNYGLFSASGDAASGTQLMRDAAGRTLSLTGDGPVAQASGTLAAGAATMDLAAFSEWLRANVGAIKAAPAAPKRTVDPNDSRLMKLASKVPAPAGAAMSGQSPAFGNAVAPAESPEVRAGVPAPASGTPASASMAAIGGSAAMALPGDEMTPSWISTRHPNAPILVNNFKSDMSPWSPEDQYLMSNWNYYAGGVFTVATNPSGTFAWGDGVFDLAGFVDDATSKSVYGSGWSCGSGCVTLGITYITWNGSNVVTEADILLNPASSWTLDDEWVFNDGSATGFRQTMFHEMGHMLGLDHNFGALAAMNYLEPGRYRAFGLPYMDDAMGIRGIYPSKATARTDLGVYLYYLSAMCSPVTFNNCVADATYPSTLVAGSNLTVNNYQVENAGTTTIATPTIEWYLTPARNFNSYYSLGTATYPSLATATSFTPSTVERTFTVPANVPAGNYYLAAFIRNDAGPSQSTFPFSNNYAFSRNQISVTAQDTTPDSFSFTSYLAAPLNSVMTSNAITVSGINAPAAISISGGGTYSVNDGGYTNSAGSVNYADSVRVRLTASGSYSTQTCTTLTIGGVPGQFCGTTQAAPADTTPNPFSFTAQTGLALNTVATSNTITVSGINSAAPISVTGGSYSVNGGGYTSGAGSVNNGNTVSVRLTSSGSYSTQTCATLTIGGVSGQFCGTTQAAPADTTPDQFTFYAQGGAALNTVATSNTITVSGISAAAPISITGGSYSVNGGAYTAASGSVNNGNTVSLHMTASASYSTQTCAMLTIGGVSAPFCVTTQAAPADTTPNPFSFTAQTGVARNAVLTSNTITVSGINAAASISVTGGSYSVNGGSYTTAPGSVNNGNTVSVRQTSSANPNTQKCATLTIGGVSSQFCVTTKNNSSAITSILMMLLD